MGEKFTKYQILQDSKPFGVDDEHPFPISNAQRSWGCYRRTQIGVLVLILSVALNLVEYFQLCQQKTIAIEASRSKFGKVPSQSLYTLLTDPLAGLQANVETQYQYKTEYSGENETLATELWEAINSTSAGAIALDHDWAKSKGLIRAQNFPWDTEKGIYYVQGIHDVHCVVRFIMAHVPRKNPIDRSAEATSKINLRVSSRAGADCQLSSLDPLPGCVPASFHVHG